MLPPISVGPLLAALAGLTSTVSAIVMLRLPEDTVGRLLVVVFLLPVVASLVLVAGATARSWVWGLLSAVLATIPYLAYAALWLRQTPGDDGLDALVYLFPAGVGFVAGLVFVVILVASMFAARGRRTAAGPNQPA